MEKIEQPSQVRHWNDSIPLEYHYTLGVAGEEFRRELKENGRFLASKCPKCKKSYLPARMFCPTCFIETKDRLRVDKPGYVYSYTTVSKSRARNETEPLVVAVIRFEGFEGGIVHRLDVDNQKQAEIGKRVEPILKPSAERTGALTDLLGFKPV